MWYILIFLTAIFAVPSGLISVDGYGLEIILNQFLLLGIIPGTNIQITFDWLIVGFWILFFYWLITKISLVGLQKHRLLKRVNHINQISL